MEGRDERRRDGHNGKQKREIIRSFKTVMCKEKIG